MDIKTLKKLFKSFYDDRETLERYKMFFNSRIDPDYEEEDEYLFKGLQSNLLACLKPKIEAYKQKEQLIKALLICLQSDDLLYNIMYYHFIDGLSWSDVAAKVSYSEGQIYRLQNKAFQLLAERSEAVARM